MSIPMLKWFSFPVLCCLLAGVSWAADNTPGVSHIILPNPLGGEVAAGYCAGIGDAHAWTAGVVSDSSGAFHLAAWKTELRGNISSVSVSGFSFLSDESWGWACARSGAEFFAGGIAGKDFRASPFGILAKFGTDGKLAAGFGDGGIIRINSPGGAGIFALAVLPDKSVIAGGTVDNGPARAAPVLWKFMPDGKPDPKFGKDGMLRLPVKEGVVDARVSTLLLSGPDLYAAGTAGWDMMLLWKIGPGGKVVTQTPAEGAARGLAAATSKLILAGFRYGHEEGQKVTSETAVFGLFAGGNWTFSDMPSGGTENNEAFSVALSGKRFFAAGYADADGGVRAAVWSFDEAGRPDAGFGRGGIFILPRVSDGKEERIFSAAPGPEESVYLCGLSRDAGKKRKAVLWKISTRTEKGKKR